MNLFCGIYGWKHKSAYFKEEVLESPSWVVFKSRLDMHVTGKVWIWMILPCAGIGLDDFLMFFSALFLILSEWWRLILPASWWQQTGVDILIVNEKGLPLLSFISFSCPVHSAYLEGYQGEELNHTISYHVGMVNGEGMSSKLEHPGSCHASKSRYVTFAECYHLLYWQWFHYVLGACYF